MLLPFQIFDSGPNYSGPVNDNMNPFMTGNDMPSLMSKYHMISTFSKNYKESARFFVRREKWEDGPVGSTWDLCAEGLGLIP